MQLSMLLEYKLLCNLTQPKHTCRTKLMPKTGYQTSVWEILDMTLHQKSFPIKLNVTLSITNVSAIKAT